MIPFNKPVILGSEQEYLADTFKKQKFSGDGYYSAKCHETIANYLGARKALLTTSCTDALEMAAILLDIKAGDEVIMPSFTFVSTSNAFTLRGAKIIFLDVNPSTMNMDENLIEKAITPKTKCIALVHYAGWSCDMDKVMEISKKHNIPVIEDAAQAYGATYKGKKLGTFGVMSAFSFHETKNLHCGEGGALVINDEKYIKRAEIVREK
ncbi:MAG: aminotransferase class I/II-fold pyridoxal phosphate-dependent enzyme, partial [Bacteriovoracaceae bacterium]